MVKNLYDKSLAIFTMVGVFEDLIRVVNHAQYQFADIELDNENYVDLDYTFSADRSGLKSFITELHKTFISGGAVIQAYKVTPIGFDKIKVTIEGQTYDK